MRTFDWSVRFGTRFLDFVQDGQCYTISPLSSLSSLLVMFSREIVHARRIATYPGCKINLNIPVVSRVRVTLVKITKPDSHTSHAGEKSSLVGYKRTPCSTPLLPLSPLFCLFLRCKLVRVRRCKIDNGVVANRMPRYEVHCSGNEFFSVRRSSLPSISNLILLSLSFFLLSIRTVARTMRRRNSSTA